jgi:chemotaxis protein histidine kinase CheA
MSTAFAPAIPSPRWKRWARAISDPGDAGEKARLILISTTALTVALTQIAPPLALAQTLEADGRVIAVDGTVLCTPTDSVPCDLEAILAQIRAAEETAAAEAAAAVAAEAEAQAARDAAAAEAASAEAAAAEAAAHAETEAAAAAAAAATAAEAEAAAAAAAEARAAEEAAAAEAAAAAAAASEAAAVEAAAAAEAEAAEKAPRGVEHRRPGGVLRPDGTYQVLKDDDTVIRQPGSTVRTETFRDGSTRTIVERTDGTQVVTIRDATGRVLRRATYDDRGREIVLIDDLQREEVVSSATAPPSSRSSSRPGQRRRLEARTCRDRGGTRRAQVLAAPDPRYPAGSRAGRHDRRLAGDLRHRLGRDRRQRGAEPGRSRPGDAGPARPQPGEVFLIEGHTDATGRRH